MEKTNITKLVIIGNGFDKWSGLQSSFGDFMLYQIEKSAPIYKMVYDMCQDTLVRYRDFQILFSQKSSSEMKDFTIWDLLFLAYSDLDNNSRWCDAEQLISNSFSSTIDSEQPKFNKVLANNIWEKCFNRLNSIPVAYDEDLIIGNTELVLISFILTVFKKKLTLHEINSSHKTQFYEYLYHQLRIFENKFRDYLHLQIQDNKTYLRNSYTLLKYISSSFESDRKVNVMSFNYTSIPNIEELHNYDNVHGQLWKNGIDECIMGIDSQDIDFDTLQYRFTKTFRKVDAYTKYPQKHIEDIFVDSIKDIRIFGHSLNEQDYAYFQSLFDIYDIYSSQVKLTFYYSVYDEEKKNEIQVQTTKNVIKLLQKYGETIKEQNTRKGRNLLHKLLIQSRLIIQEIPQDYDSIIARNKMYEDWIVKIFPN